MKRAFRILLNLFLLLSLIPTLVFGLVGWIRLGRPDFGSDLGMGILNLSLTGLVIWHVLVWEHRIEIHRKWILFLVRSLKAVWTCSIMFVLVAISPHERVEGPLFHVAVPLVVGGAVYAGLRQLFAPPFRI